MIPALPSPLPPRDRLLLQVAHRITPTEERADWLRTWEAELWHRHHPRGAHAHSAHDLYTGLLRDALWLRHESWRRLLAGTAVLCLTVLAVLVLLAVLPLLVLFGDLSATGRFLLANTPRFLVEATLTTVASFALAARPTTRTGVGTPRHRLRAWLFQAAKLLLLQALACLLSLDLTQPLHAAYPFTAEVLQPQLCTVFALLALRWSFGDQDTRCRHCLRSLSAPLRVGRPSWNFLDSNGTHLACPDGHGLLSVPEIETSWRQSSEWIPGELLSL